MSRSGDSNCSASVRSVHYLHICGTSRPSIPPPTRSSHLALRLVSEAGDQKVDSCVRRMSAAEKAFLQGRKSFKTSPIFPTHACANTKPAEHSAQEVLKSCTSFYDRPSKKLSRLMLYIQTEVVRFTSQHPKLAVHPRDSQRTPLTPCQCIHWLPAMHAT